jgi:FkbM family methyltransferase
MPMISYAQNREDILLARIFAGRKEGFYVDVGANDPKNCSVTKYFYELGWHGVNVEPNRKFPLLAADRPRDVNLNVAVGDQDGEQTFFEFSQNPALSTFIQLEADEHRQRFGYDYVAHRVPVRTLASICSAHGVNEIDFMSIDVEGYERQVLSGADWRRWRPRVVLIEATRPHLTETTHAGWESLLFAADYRFSYFDGLNRFYLRSEDAHLKHHFDVPPNVFDDYILYEHIAQVESIGAQCQQRIDELVAIMQRQHEAIERLKAECERLQGLLPFAAQWHRFAERYPRVANLARRMAHRPESEATQARRAA